MTSITPPNLTGQTTIASGDLMLVWPVASIGPLQRITYANFKTQLTTDFAGSFLTPGNNLSDVGNPTTARTNLGLGTAATANVGTSGATLPALNTANTWSAAQTLTVAPVFTDASGSRAALGLGTAATATIGTSGATVPVLNAANTWSSAQAFATISTSGAATLGSSSSNVHPVSGVFTLATTPAFLAHLSADKSNVTGDGTAYRVLFDSVDRDATSSYNSGTGQFTAAFTGWHMFGATLTFGGVTTSDTDFNIDIDTTAGTYRLTSGKLAPDSAGRNGNPVMMQVYLTAGQTADILATVSGSTKTVSVLAGAGNKLSFFWGRYMG